MTDVREEGAKEGCESEALLSVRGTWRLEGFRGVGGQYLLWLRSHRNFSVLYFIIQQVK